MNSELPKKIGFQSRSICDRNTSIGANGFLKKPVLKLLDSFVYHTAFGQQQQQRRRRRRRRQQQQQQQQQRKTHLR